jgi:hypothetical protein
VNNVLIFSDQIRNKFISQEADSFKRKGDIMKVRELLSDESKWTQGSMAIDSNGEETVPDLADTVCWCLLGAVEACYGPTLDEGPIINKIREEINAPPYKDVHKTCLEITNWNDDPKRKFKEVKTLVEKLDI